MSVEQEIAPLTEPREGIPSVLTTPDELKSAADALFHGRGSLAVDAERASGYRYGQRAFLVQMRRDGAGTFLIDPTALPDLSLINEALEDVEWVLHAASQDLPCLADLGLQPTSLFDTELAARLLGMPKVGLAAVVASTMGLGLAKEHSAADWSQRPLPQDWLRYAALDVEVLVEVRDILDNELHSNGKSIYAAEEFEHVRTAPPPRTRKDPWRRTSGIHALRDARSLAVVKEMWTARDQLARHRDIAPARILPDSAIIAAASAMPTDVSTLLTMPIFSGRHQRHHARTWFAAIERARTLPNTQLPTKNLPHVGPPHPRSWSDKNPEAAQRLADAKEQCTHFSEELSIPVENLLQPDVLRKLCWEPPHACDAEHISLAMQELGARPWQAELLSPELAKIFTSAENESVNL